MKKSYETPEINVISLVSEEEIMEPGGKTDVELGSGIIDA